MADISAVQLAFNLVLGGGLVGVFLRYRIQDRKLSIEETDEQRQARRSDLDKALDVVTDQRNDAIKAIHDCHSRLEKMEMEVQGLRLARDLDPFPHWVTSLEGKYIYVNREFEKEFLEPQDKSYRDVIGSSHADLWPEAFCRTLHTLDDLAKRVPDGHARATTNLVIGVVERQITVQKFPIRIRGAIVAFAGYITDILASNEISI